MANLSVPISQQFKTAPHESLKSMFDLYYADLCRFGCSIVGDEHTAEEIVQDLFVTLWEKHKKIEFTGSVKSYLFKSVYNRCISFLKRNKNHILKIEDLTSNELIENRTILDEILDDELKNKLEDAINALPVKCRSVLMMSRFSGMSYKEIAEEMDISVKTVENQISRAFKKIRATLIGCAILGFGIYKVFLEFLIK